VFKHIKVITVKNEFFLRCIDSVSAVVFSEGIGDDVQKRVKGSGVLF